MFTLSKYVSELKKVPEVYDRYIQKIKLINNIDPYLVCDGDLDFSLDSVPQVTNMDIVSYLVLTHSFYSQQQMKAYKSLEAYKYFESGFIEKLGIKKINSHFLVIGKVKHSQKTRQNSLQAWIIIESNGSICTAHCTCMAGLGEVCSHIGALLYATEYANRCKESISCTDVKAVWPVPSQSTVEVVPVAEMDWGRTIQSRPSICVTPLEKDSLVDFIKKIRAKNSDCAIARVTKPFIYEYKQHSDLPSLMMVYDSNNESLSLDELIRIGESIDLKLFTADEHVIEERTRNQHKSIEWFKQRGGRITASKFKSVCKTKLENPSISLLKQICYPAKVVFSTAAVKWGIKHEEIAADTYFKQANKNHLNLQMEKIGLVFHKRYLQLTASLDRRIECDCCGLGCLEIKCPYVLFKTKKTILEYAELKNSCLIKENDCIKLNRNHSYYYQIQLQMYLSGSTYCDFFLWAPHITFTERVQFHEPFIISNLEKVLKFHSSVIMPELLGRYFTKNSSKEKWCICKQPDDGRPMIKCVNETCEIQWFHMECINMTCVPDESWHCQLCQEI